MGVRQVQAVSTEFREETTDDHPAAFSGMPQSATGSGGRLRSIIKPKNVARERSV